MNTVKQMVLTMGNILERTYPERFQYIAPEVTISASLVTYMFASPALLIKINRFGVLSVFICGQEEVDVCILGDTTREGYNHLPNTTEYEALSCVNKYLIGYKKGLQLQLENAPSL